MTTYELYREQWVPRPLEEVFEFFSRPENLAKITPASLGFEIITPQPIAMHAGALIDYTVRPFGIPIHWTTLIADYEPPHRFVDVQLKGPYAFWHHTHTFESARGGTRLTDRVRYALPFGPLGRIANSLAVKRQLRGIFDHRERVIAEQFSGVRQNGEAVPDRDTASSV
jgi:ligand-binding SRPBCC domain-containing protein